MWGEHETKGVRLRTDAVAYTRTSWWCVCFSRRGRSASSLSPDVSGRPRCRPIPRRRERWGDPPRRGEAASPAGSDRWRRFRVRRGMQSDLSAPVRPTRTEYPMSQSAPHDPAGHGRETYGRASDTWLGQVRASAHEDPAAWLGDLRAAAGDQPAPAAPPRPRPARRVAATGALVALFALG